MLYLHVPRTYREYIGEYKRIWDVQDYIACRTEVKKGEGEAGVENLVMVVREKRVSL